MNWYQVLIAAVVGSVIGYTTNWVAIRMLFRPHYEKKILGLRIPFTPGVIPRGKKRLAKGMADMVSDMLITDQSVIQHLSRPQSERKIRCYLTTRLAKMRDQQLTVGHFLNSIGLDDRVQAESTARVAEMVVYLFQSETGCNALANLMEDLTVHLLDQPVASTPGESGWPEVKKMLETLSRSLLQEQNLQGMETLLAQQVECFFNSPKPLGDYLPTAAREGIHRFIADQAPRIAAAMEQYLSSPDARQAIKNRIDDLFEGTAFEQVLGGIFRLLGNGSDMLTQRLIREVSLFLTDQRILNEIVDKLHLLADETLEKSVGEITATLDTSDKRKKSNEIATWLVEQLSSPRLADTVQEAVQDLLEQNRERTWREFFNLVDRDIQVGLVEFYQKLLIGLLNKEDFRYNLQSHLQGYMENLRHEQVGRLLDLAEANGLNPVDILLGWYRFFVQQQVPGLMKFLNIGAMVEKQVEEQDVYQVEQMLLGIMRRELIAVTWFGGFLGALLGFITAGMQILMK